MNGSIPILIGKLLSTFFFLPLQAYELFDDDSLEQSLLMLCTNNLLGGLKDEMQPKNVAEPCFCFWNCNIASFSSFLPSFQTALWGWQWVLFVSERVVSQPENTKVDKGWVGHNQKTDGKTSKVRYIFNNPYYCKNISDIMNLVKIRYLNQIFVTSERSLASHCWYCTSSILATASPASLSHNPSASACFSDETFKCKLLRCFALMTPAGAHQHSSTRSGRRCDRNGRRCACCSRERCPTYPTAKTSQTKYRSDSTLEQKLQVSWEPHWV